MDRTGFDSLPLEWVRAFEATARCGSFTAAATETGLTQSAISQRIANLEQRLGVRLFLRGGRTISLTVDGEAWLPHVQGALSALRESTETLFGAPRTRLAISASTSIAELWIAPRLQHLRQHAGIEISIRTMMVSGDDDAGDVIRIRYGSGDWPDMHKAPLYDEVMAPLAAPGLLQSGGAWHMLPRIALSGPRPDWAEWARHRGTPTTPVATFRFDTFSSALATAIAGQGVLLGSVPLCRQALAEGRLVRLTEDVLATRNTYWMLAAQRRMSRVRWENLVSVLVDGAGPPG